MDHPALQAVKLLLELATVLDLQTKLLDLVRRDVFLLALAFLVPALIEVVPAFDPLLA